MRNLRFEKETDDEFRTRAEQTARYARILVKACLANLYVQDLIADDEFPFYTRESFSADPVVRVDYQEAYVIACIGEGIAAARNKAWGDGPRILPIDPYDEVGPVRIGYVYKETSRYNRRFEQRKRMKELLGKRYRPLVTRAKYHRVPQKQFLAELSAEEERVIRRVFDCDPRTFWRAVRGTIFLDLPPRMVQLALFDE